MFPNTTTDPFHLHEALDRAHLIAGLWDRTIVDHPVVRANPDLAARAGQIAELIAAFYQQVGGLSLDPAADSP